MKNLSIRKMNELSKKKKKGFTLVELVIVIAIIAILAAMAIPKFSSMRIDAKVSNDIAAAKNIATVTSTLVANGEITASTIDLSDATATGSAMKIKKNLDGKVAVSGSTEALSSGHFSVTVAANETITVSAVGTATYVLYPDNNGALRTAYSAAVK